MNWPGGEVMLLKKQSSHRLLGYMRIHACITIVVTSLIAIADRGILAQGFVKLDFEGANLSGYSSGLVPTVDAVPGWTVYLDGAAQTSIPYDSNSSSSPVFASLESGSLLQGQYFIALTEIFISPPTQTYTAAIGQAGQIPVGAQSLTFIGNTDSRDLQITFNGSPISFVTTDSTSHYMTFGAYISQFAGDTGQLLFTLTSESDLFSEY
jgi:hypothetical protein